MATLFQGLTAVTPLSPSNSIESNKLLFSSRRSFSGLIFVVFELLSGFWFWVSLITKWGSCIL
jgi:hypothetical protein